ncbi:DUF4439 domain-containing protein [Kineosporia succinea]|uniref:DUF4439 domain-containing protein n=1 Tax=Kineosporia succinea TaxID=84632 RepID=A0ABT9NW80_9ACTN|nr:DUF4439 domain-containing protein [Kineosporia succinea]MDP9824681.1 hypothetical protein [Kineosporia succinea]
MLSSKSGTSLVRPRRRAFLALGTLSLAGGATTVLTGCSSSGSNGSALTPAASTQLEEAAVNRAVELVRAVHTGASALASGTVPGGAAARLSGAVAKLLPALLKVHATQLSALGAPVSTSPATPSTSSESPTPSTEDADAVTSPATLVTAEWEAARTLLRDAAGLSPEFARLLYRTAASCAAAADLLNSALKGKSLGALKPAESTEAAGSAEAAESTEPAAPATAPPTTTTGPTPSATGTATPTTTSSSSAALTLVPAETTALNRLLAGEHAAYYAYPLVIAHIDGPREEVATTVWQTHRQQRDELERMLLTAGADPVEANAAYEVETPTTKGQAATLATTVEERLAGLAADAVAAATHTEVQSLAADLLVGSVRRQAAWSGEPVA